MTTSLIEYHWVSWAVGYQATGNTFTFDPSPAKIDKSATVFWKVRKARGPHNFLQKARYRGQKVISWKLSGILKVKDIKKLEAFAKRHSKFKFQTDIKSPGPEDSNTSEPDYPPLTGQEPDEYVVITAFRFIQAEFKGSKGKEFVKYDLTLQRVSTKDISL